MKTLTLKLPQELETKLAAAARRQRRTKSDVARQALEAYLNGGKEAGQGAFLELAADLVGSLEGPGDLSHNPKYMDGFGT
jgi:hypothetical protein